MSTLHIAAFGEVMMRLEVPGHELLSQSNQLNYSFSGTGVNVAGALACLGYSTYVVSTLPANAVGDAAVSYLQRLGISNQFINRNGNYIGMYFLENGFGVRSSRVTYSNRMESSFNTAAVAAYDANEIAQHIDVIHFCGISLAMNEVVREQMKALANAVKAKGGRVVFDCNYRPSLWGENGYQKARSHYEEMLSLSDVVMMNENDAMYVLGMNTDKELREDQLEELLPVVAKKYNISVLAGTHRTILDDNKHALIGFIYREDSFTYSKKVTFTVLDRIGAGDAFTSGIIHGMLNGYTPTDTVEFAVTAGMLGHTIVGDTPLLSESDIIAAMGGVVSDVKR